MPSFLSEVINEYQKISNGDNLTDNNEQSIGLQPPAFEPTAGGSGGSFYSIINSPRSLSKCLDVVQLSDEEIQKEIQMIEKWISENAGSSKMEILIAAKEELIKEQEYRETYDEISDQPHNQNNLMGDQGEMTRLILSQVGYEDPKKWYSEMVSIKFFGRTAKGIRRQFAEQLKDAERRTLDKLAKLDPSLSDPRKAAEYLGINESYKTSRIFKPEKPEYQSMHLFGLAIDINFVNNPWVTQQAGTKEGTRANKKIFRDFVKRMDGLFNTDTNSKYKYVGADRQIEDDGEFKSVFDGYAGVDKLTEKYFALLKDDEELQKLLDTTEAKEWKNKKLGRARKMIKDDLKLISKKSSRGNKKKNFAKEGIMDLNKELVMSMHEAKLDWGGKYGDMMHFDMRFFGDGEKIQEAKKTGKTGALKRKLKAK